MPKEKKAAVRKPAPMAAPSDYRYRVSDLESTSVTVYSTSDDQKQRVLVNGCLVY